MKMEYVFSDPECPLVCNEWEVWKAISIILKGGQGTLRSDVWYSRISVFSLKEVLLNFQKHLKRFLFPKIVISALIGLTLYLYQDFTCLITGSTFWCFCNNSWVIFSVVARKTFSISVFDKGIVSRGSWRIKTCFIVYFDSLFRGPDKFIFSFRFYFSPKGNRSVFIWFLFDWFLLCIVFINDEYEIGLNVDFPCRSTSQWLFWQSKYSGKYCRLFICVWSMSVFTAYLHCILGEVSSFATKNLMFWGTLTVFFNNSGGVFLLRVSVSTRFFPAVPLELH